MPDQTPLSDREYTAADDAMIVGIGAIAASALEHQSVLEEEDTTLTKTYLQGLAERIKAAATTILGHDNAKDMRGKTGDLNDNSTAALDALGSILNTVNTKYRGDTARRDEILRTMGFSDFYDHASHKDQQAIGHLLSRAAAALAADGKALQTELTGKGMNVKRADTVTALAATYTADNTGQEASKGARKLLSAGDVASLNTLYHETMEVAKTARHYFRADGALRSLFVFSKVVPPSHGRQDGGDKPAAA